MSQRTTQANRRPCRSSPTSADHSINRRRGGHSGGSPLRDGIEGVDGMIVIPSISGGTGSVRGTRGEGAMTRGIVGHAPVPTRVPRAELVSPKTLRPGAATFKRVAPRSSCPILRHAWQPEHLRRTSQTGHPNLLPPTPHCMMRMERSIARPVPILSVIGRGPRISRSPLS